ncbi:MAG: hypothetical protein UR96_C0003G0009 [candidate division WS6 bacterium GW2011_GWC1_36_11]|uniref:SCP domain-containing protein n=1 Tax=candidate division WS6 bacterium GW2011_GWC1_36_11 TaxID=1619090 RepID=A0A0G0DHH6_9BACT|nr:MAG: hypothetical protein UR96_C0003G0009 [candidate division WS6 bacterium GW2011_GWC1_36_11]KKQ03914.1 MAG: hypothetical protein US14_C0030G0008 [candidate division WS6 bacterium GW2011_WS6_36_26]HAM96507.1 hypothetical protein [Patescibacteria group bacterium]
MKNFFIPTQQNKYKPYLLRKIALVAYSLLLVFVNSFGGVFGIDQAQASNITPSNIISLTNQERSANGLNTLKDNSKLAAAALAKANNMFEEQYWDHFGPNGETPWQYIRAEGYDYVYAGENLAKGFQTSEGVHEAWMASPTHAANIMSANYKDIGVAVVQGVLLGKQTTLVVQMFGNLTTEVASATTGATKITTSGGTVIGTEHGDIKSIMITSPTQSLISTDPGINVKGEVANSDGEYTVQVYDQSEVVGETSSKSSNWEFEKGSDWSEGSHLLKAQIKGESTVSENVDFTVDSTPPQISTSSISVKLSEDVYVLSFKIDDTWTDLRIINGSATIPVTSENKMEIIVEVPVKGLGNKVVIMASDIQGNIAQLDITEYFPEEGSSKGTSIFLSITNANVGDQISIGIVSLIFVLLCIEIFVYWKKGKLKEITGDLFTIGTWWLILTIAIFNGFTGLIN